METHGFGIPLTELAPRMPCAHGLETLSHDLARWFPNLFAYQFLLVCRRPYSHRELMKSTFTEIPVDAK